MRTRSFRRAARERVILRRLRHIREWSSDRWDGSVWGQDVPGLWAKQDPYAHGRCRVCRWDHLEARRRMETRLAREAISSVVS